MKGIPHPIVLDANVLLPPTLSDLILRLAEDPALIQPKWSSEILSEVSKNQLEHGWDPSLVQSWREAVTKSFPEATVTGYKTYLAECANNLKDRHVLAVAIRSRSDTILTNNLKHFPREALDPHLVRAVSPDQFLADLAEVYPTVLRLKFEEAAKGRRRNTQTALDHYQTYMPRFAIKMRELL